MAGDESLVTIIVRATPYVPHRRRLASPDRAATHTSPLGQGDGDFALRTTSAYGMFLTIHTEG
jgi:hypothetical protein